MNGSAAETINYKAERKVIGLQVEGRPGESFWAVWEGLHMVQTLKQLQMQSRCLNLWLPAEFEPHDKISEYL